AILRVESRDVVTDPQRENVRAVYLREPQERERRPDALHDGADTEPHLERIRIVAAWCRRFQMIDRAVADEGGENAPLLAYRPSESIQSTGWYIADEIRPWSVRQAACKLRLSRVAVHRRLAGRKCRALHSCPAPPDEMLMQQIGRGLLYELELELADLAPLVPERGHTLMGMIFRVPYEHQWQRRAAPRPIIVRIAPDPAELRDDRPIASSVARAVLRDELSARQRIQNISGRDEAECDAREEPRIAP